MGFHAVTRPSTREDLSIEARFHTVAFESPSLTEDLLVASHT